jgi:hypothetical protein
VKKRNCEDGQQVTVHIKEIGMMGYINLKKE